MANLWSEWISAKYGDALLPNNRWIAVYNKDIVASDESIDTVIQKVDENYELSSVSFAYITYDVWQ